MVPHALFRACNRCLWTSTSIICAKGSLNPSVLDLDNSDARRGLIESSSQSWDFVSKRFEPEGALGDQQCK